MFVLSDAVAVRGGYFGTGIGRIHIASVKCARSEQRLIDCARDGIIGGRCTHSRDAGVICQGMCQGRAGGGRNAAEEGITVFSMCGSPG